MGQRRAGVDVAPGWVQVEIEARANSKDGVDIIEVGVYGPAHSLPGSLAGFSSSRKDLRGPA